jgi:peptide-methionine (R)-S-oxide reductase
VIEPVSRRTFCVAAATAALGALAGCGAKRSASGMPGGVTIEQFSDDGTSSGLVTVPKMIKTEAEWRTLLPPESFAVTRHAGTEAAFSGEYWNLHDDGLYRCICCETAVFSANAKFESGTGWPSFWQPLASTNIVVTEDGSLGMIRTAVSCVRCDGHLGHVFNDGPQPTGLRYCLNSVSLKFIKSA